MSKYVIVICTVNIARNTYIFFKTVEKVSGNFLYCGCVKKKINGTKSLATNCFRLFQKEICFKCQLKTLRSLTLGATISTWIGRYAVYLWATGKLQNSEVRSDTNNLSLLLLLELDHFPHSSTLSVVRRL